MYEKMKKDKGLKKGYIKIILWLGILVGLSTFLFVVWGIIIEAEILLSEGISFFISDILSRSVFGIILSLIGAAPYIVAYLISSKIKYPIALLITGIIVFILDIFIRINLIFFPTSSTSALGIIFLPFLIVFLLVVIFGIVYVIVSANAKKNKSQGKK